MEIKRRDFLKLLGASAAGLAIGSVTGAVVKIPKVLEPVMYSGPRIESWKLTACMKCPGGCSLKVRMIDKFPIQSFGNQLSPINEGGICSKGLASISELYHPSRLTGPLKKVNDKFISITYNEAYKILLDNLKNTISEKRQDDIFIIAQTESRLRADLFTRFSKEAGIKNLIIDNYLYNSKSPYNDVSNEAPDFIDFDTSDYLLNFGSQLSELSVNPLFFSRKLIEFREKGNKITYFGPKLTSDISKLDEWLPVQPASYADLALGLAYVLLKDGLYDKNAETAISGFNSLKKYILDNYYPDMVEKSTGIPAETVLQIGRKFEKASAPAAYFDESILYSSNGTHNAFAIIFLNALNGFKGFGKIKDEFYSSIITGGNSAIGTTSFYTFKNRLAGKNNIKMLMNSGSNFIFNNTDQEKLKKQISSIPFIVSFSPFIDETSALAHLIIPDHNDFEKLDLNFNESIGNSVITVQQPVVDPFFRTIDTGDILISLIKDLNKDTDFKYDSVNDYVKFIAKQLYKNGDGTLMSQLKFTEIEKGLRKIGWGTDQYSDFDDFWDNLLEYGGWWNPFGERSSYLPKINFAGKLSAGRTNNSLIKTPPKDKFRLNIFRKNLDYKGSLSLYPVLIEQFGHNWSVFYELWVEINPETARSKSLGDKSRVFIKTGKGKFPAFLVYNPAVIPGSLDVPFGLGHTILGDTSGINPLCFSDNIFDEDSGKPSFTETLAEIQLASSNNSYFAAKSLNRKKDLPGSTQRSIYA